MAAYGIALVYVKDQFRHRLPHILLACYVILLFLTLLMPAPDPLSKARMLRGIALGAIGWIGAPAALRDDLDLPAQLHLRRARAGPLSGATAHGAASNHGAPARELSGG